MMMKDDDDDDDSSYARAGHVAYRVLAPNCLGYLIPRRILISSIARLPGSLSRLFLPFRLDINLFHYDLYPTFLLHSRNLARQPPERSVCINQPEYRSRI
jgi:hypothetical protein